MARDTNIAVQYGQYLALRGVAGLVHCFDPEENLHTAAAIGDVFYRLNRRRRERAEANIASSFPELSAERVRAIARRSFQYMFQLFMVESIATPRLITPETWPRYVRLGNLGPVLDQLIKGRPMIFLTGHCGNWELLGFVLAVIGYPLAVLARPLDNRFIDRWLLGIREARGMRVITKWGATPVVQNVLVEGGRIGFIADQNAGDQGLFVPFFGRLASNYKSIGLLAMHHRVPIVAGHARRLGNRLEYEMSCTDFISPEDWEDQPDPLFYITARYNRAMERMIREAPEQYLWLHRRWKSRPRHERRGEPVPDRLIERLRSLPWMTGDEIDRIVTRSNEAASAGQA